MSLEAAQTSSDSMQRDLKGSRSVRAQVNDTCLRQLETEKVLGERGVKALRELLEAERPPKPDELVSLFQESSEGAAP